ncbi:Dimeric alpha-beta barrel [Penicillium waksmanii]|uniref:Dimeric alpha-beta barrel n=1 Tax=Penicillium waksmanii TaxID=69791 RepID=UPI0025474BE4|nr:Dimeric alpha-beta barrel [Penicillium waksmanii]KAJ5988013.1 Dimeric alpha-beta barrel [Penicillium waksmanii]
MPLIERRWKRYGVQSWSCLYAFGSIVAWESKEGFQKAFGSPEVAKIVSDVPKFSNKRAVFLFGSKI